MFLKNLMSYVSCIVRIAPLITRRNANYNHKHNVVTVMRVMVQPKPWRARYISTVTS